MAFTAEQYQQAWSSATFGEVRRKSLMFGLTSRMNTEAWVNGSTVVNIPLPAWTNVASTDRARGANWVAAKDVSQTLKKFERSGGLTVANKVLWEDQIEVPWAVVEETRSRQAYEMSKTLDDKVYAAITAAIAGETSTPNFQAYGSNTNSIDRVSGKAANAAAEALPYEIIDDFSLKLANSDLDPGDGQALGQKYVVMRPTVFRVLSNYLLDKRYSYDPITTDVLQQNTLFAGASWEGRLKGIDIYSWTGSPMPTGKKSNTAANRAANWQVLCGVRNGAIANTRPPLTQFFTPSTNQVSPNPEYLLRQVMEYGHLVMDESYFTLAGIDGGADS